MDYDLSNMYKLSEPQMNADETIYMIYVHQINHSIMGICGSDSLFTSFR